MNTLAIILTAFVAVEHLYILWIEMFAWETVGKKTFNTFPKELFKPTKGLAANQGLYNGFLSAGLTWSFFIQDASWSDNVRIFFLSCVIIAGVFGGLTVSRKILYTQAFPAVITLIVILLS